MEKTRVYSSSLINRELNRREPLLLKIKNNKPLKMGEKGILDDSVQGLICFFYQYNKTDIAPQIWVNTKKIMLSWAAKCSFSQWAKFPQMNGMS